MRNRYSAEKIPATILAGDWYVRENHEDGMTAHIVCCCNGEVRARHIAKALNCMDAITEAIEECKS